MALNRRSKRVCAAHYAPSRSFQIFERRHGLAEIIERRTGVSTISHMAPNAPRRVVGQWGGAGGAICEDHFGLAGGGMRVAFDGEAFLLYC